ncbi:MAG: hypothetical protein JRE58_10430 [Deltaproteobacteria bacterium]|nr:hypothetical protein [Deltaproteobacteria bacterium]
MSITTAIRKYVDQAFSAVGNLSENATYRVCTAQTHNANTYELEQTFQDTLIKILVTTYSRIEIDFHPDFAVTDRKILIPAKYLDEIITGSQIITQSTTYEIISVEKDPSDSLYYVQGRA